MDSPEFRAQIILAATYLIVIAAVHLRLAGRLSRSAKGIAAAMLVAQIIALSLSLSIERSYEHIWFFYVNQEHNFPSVLASTQLALVGFVAFIAAGAGRQWPTPTRLYFVLVGTAFIYLALDEYVTWHEWIEGWHIRIAALGLVVAAATVFIAKRSPREERIWHLCFLIGLALSASGALVLELFTVRELCIPTGFWNDDYGYCLLTTIEEGLEFLGIWLVLVAVLGHYSRLSLQRALRIAVLLFPVIWVLLHPPRSFPPLPALVEYIEYRFMQHVNVEYEGGMRLVAYRLDIGEDAVDVELVASPATWRDYIDLGYSLHLVDQGAYESLAGLDLPARRNPTVAFRDSLHYKMRLTLQPPPPTEIDRPVWVVLTLVKRSGQDFPRQRALSSDLPLFGDDQVILGEFVILAEPGNG